MATDSYTAKDLCDALRYARETMSAMAAGQAVRDLDEQLSYINLLLSHSYGPSLPVMARGELTDEQIKEMCRPGPIEVVYPLDEEWNAAIDAAAKVADQYPGVYGNSPTAKEIRKLRRTDATRRSQE